MLAMIEADPDARPRRWSPACPTCAAEAVYAARYEMARTLDDVLARRTRALAPRPATPTVDAAADVAKLLAAELGWSPARASTAGRGVSPRHRRARGRRTAASVAVTTS